jgi:hypothetical protein
MNSIITAETLKSGARIVGVYIRWPFASLYRGLWPVYLPARVALLDRFPGRCFLPQYNRIGAVFAVLVSTRFSIHVSGSVLFTVRSLY